MINNSTASRATMLAPDFFINLRTGDHANDLFFFAIFFLLRELRIENHQKILKHQQKWVFLSMV